MKKLKRKKTITICSSAFFAREAKNMKKKVGEMGFHVLLYPLRIKINNKNVPVTAYYEMRKKRLDENILSIKGRLMTEHLKKIERSDAILALNFEKDKKDGYIGGNTFIEMAIAFYLKKKIFLINPINTEQLYAEEMLAMKPIVLKNIGDIKKYLE